MDFCDCEWTRQAIDAAADVGLPDDQQALLDRSLALCADCRGYRDGLPHYRAAMAELPAPVAPAELASLLSLDVLEARAAELQAAEATPAPAPPQPLRAGHWLAAAATLVCVCLLGFAALVSSNIFHGGDLPDTRVEAPVDTGLGSGSGSSDRIPVSARPEDLEAALARYRRAEALADTGRRDEALEAVDAALALAPRHLGFSDKALLWAGELESDPEQALARFDALLRDFPGADTAPAALLEGAARLDALGRGDEAAKRREQLCDDHPRSAEAREAALALARASSGKRQRDWIRWLTLRAPGSAEAKAARALVKDD